MWCSHALTLRVWKSVFLVEKTFKKKKEHSKNLDILAFPIQLKLSKIQLYKKIKKDKQSGVCKNMAYNKKSKKKKKHPCFLFVSSSF